MLIHIQKALDLSLHRAVEAAVVKMKAVYPAIQDCDENFCCPLLPLKRLFVLH